MSAAGSDGAVLLSGIMYKRGQARGKFDRKSWKKRMFTLTRYELNYYANEDQRVLKGTVALRLCTRAESVENGTFSDHNEFVFQLSYVDKIGPCTLYIQATDFDQRLQWLTTLRTTLHTMGAKPRATYHPGVLSRMWSCCGQPENKANPGSSGCTRATSWVPGAAGADVSRTLTLTPHSSPSRNKRPSNPGIAGGGGGGDAAAPPTPGGGRNATISAQDVGCRVSVEGYDVKGTLQFVGKHHESGKRRCGVELDAPVGNNSGSVKGFTYFECPAKCGVLISPSKVSKLPPRLLDVPSIPDGEVSEDEWDEADYMTRYHPVKVTLTRATGSFGVRFVGPKEAVNVATSGRGLYLSDPAPRSPAEKVGLQSGLRVLAMNGVFLAKEPLRTLSALLPGLQQSIELVVVNAAVKYETFQRQAALDMMAVTRAGGRGGGGDAAQAAAAAQAERETSWAADVESEDEWGIEDYEANCEVTTTTLTKPDGINASSAAFGVVFRGVTEAEDHLICGHGLYIVRLMKGSLAEDSGTLHVGQRVLSMEGTFLAKEVRPTLDGLIPTLGKSLTVQTVDARRRYKRFKEALCSNKECGYVVSETAAFCKKCGTKSSRKKRDKWEIDRLDIELTGDLGAGNFGEVKAGLLRTKLGSAQVAVKTCKDGLPETQTKIFMAEAIKMKHWNHPNLIRLHGLCTMDGPVWIVLEMAPGGGLEEYLRTKKADQLQAAGYCKLLLDVASGMAYMSNMNWVHIDLAARNILCDNIKYLAGIDPSPTAKVCDFGLAMQLPDESGFVKVPKGIPLPVRWTAPEVWRTKSVNAKTDVWSFGVVMHEILSRCKVYPYYDIAGGSRDVFAKVFAGHRMEREVKYIAKQHYELMLLCWAEADSMRPSFDALCVTFREWMETPLLDRKGDWLVDGEGAKVTSGLFI